MKPALNGAETAVREHKGSTELRAIDEVAVELGIDPKRLRGYVFRNSVRHGDPIGNASLVYDWSLAALRKRLADQPTVTLERRPGAGLELPAGAILLEGSNRALKSSAPACRPGGADRASEVQS